ncbi:MAG: histidine kinase dimerization/phosphoacceptor domain -containing protein, partial [Bacteroidota bacterium]
DLGDSLGAVKCDMNIGSSYLDMNELEPAREYFQQILPYLQRHPQAYHQSTLGRAYGNLGLAHLRLKDSIRAEEYYLKGLEIFEKLDHKYDQSISLLNLGSLYSKQGKLEKARSFFARSRRLGEEIQSESRMLVAEIGMASVLGREGKYQAAIRLFEKQLTKSYQIKARKSTQDILKNLSRIYEKAGQYQSALVTERKYWALSDSLSNEEQTRQTTQMEMQFRFDQEKERLEFARIQQENVLQTEVKQQKFFRNASLLGLLAVGLILLLLWRGYRNKLAANQLLSQQKATIEQSLEEREMLLQEIHHRVKNNLQVVSSLLGLQSRSIEDETALEALEEGRNRVKAMALIHQNLYQQESLMNVDLPDYIQKLSGNLLQSYQLDQKVKLVHQIAPISLDVDILIPLGLILNELISNSLKHAFSQNEAGQIDIVIEQKEEELAVEVRDNGAGLPNGFSMEQSASLGFKLIRSFVQKMAGKLDVSSEDGTSIRMQFPHPA